jgi:4-hydroxy-2-oxoheptanedioate aldolase
MRGTQAVSGAEELRARLAARTPTFLLAVRAWPELELLTVLRDSGHHGVYLDLQHGAMSLETASRFCHGAQALGIPALVRVPAIDAGLIGRVLDHGATGILVPDVETVAQARAVAEAALHPPQGRRSQAGVRGFRVEASPFIALMLESATGMTGAREIAQAAPIDAIFIGMQDLSHSLGEGGGTELGAATRQAVELAVLAGQATGVPTIIAGMRDPAQLAEWVEKGASPCFSVGTDAAYFAAAARDNIRRFRTQFPD